MLFQKTPKKMKVLALVQKNFINRMGDFEMLLGSFFPKNCKMTPLQLSTKEVRNLILIIYFITKIVTAVEISVFFYVSISDL